MRTLVYGTLEEFGIGVVQPTESIARVCAMGSNRSASEDDKYAAYLACGANRLMRDRFPTAPLVDPTKDSAVDAGWQRGSWDSVIMDFGDPSYADFQVNAAPLPLLDIELTRNARGVCRLTTRGWLPSSLTARPPACAWTAAISSAR